MTYKVVDTLNPRFTSTAPRYAVYRKRRLFGWIYIGNSHDRNGNALILKDFASIPHNDGEWIWVKVGRPS